MPLRTLDPISRGLKRIRRDVVGRDHEWLRTLDPISRGLKLEEDGEFILCKYDEFFVKELHADTHTLKVEVRNRDGVKKFDDLMLTTFELILSDCFEKLKDHNYETLRI